MALEQHLRRRVLEHGLLPAQLPPLFCSDSLATSVEDIDRDLTVRSDGNGKTWTEPSRSTTRRTSGQHGLNAASPLLRRPKTGELVDHVRCFYSPR